MFLLTDAGTQLSIGEIWNKNTETETGLECAGDGVVCSNGSYCATFQFTTGSTVSWNPKKSGPSISSDPGTTGAKIKAWTGCVGEGEFAVAGDNSNMLATICGGTDDDAEARDAVGSEFNFVWEGITFKGTCCICSKDNCPSFCRTLSVV